MSKHFIKPACSTCGGNIVRRDDGQFVCEHCGNIYIASETREELPSDIIRQLNNANDLRITQRQFDEAANMYETIIESYPDQLDAYWGAFLSEYGIEYVKQENGRGVTEYKPICHRISRFPATQSVYLEKLYKRCDAEEEQKFRMKADEIERIRSSTYEISKNQEPCDVLICHAGKQREIECETQLKTMLESKGKKVFVARPSQKVDITNEARIFNAINTAEYLFVIADVVESISATQNVWQRFVLLEGKEIQVLHNNLNEREFPYNLRKELQRRETINIYTAEWLRRAVEFATASSARKVEDYERDRKDDGELDDLKRKNLEFERKLKDLETMSKLGASKDLPEMFVKFLTCITLGRVDDASFEFNLHIKELAPPEILTVAELCLELLKLTQSNEAKRREIMVNVGIIAERIKSHYPVATTVERNLYSAVRKGNLLIYLAKCFGVTRDYDRQCFVLDLVDCSEINEMSVIGDLLAMLLANNRTDDVARVLKEMPHVDGDRIFPMFLGKFNSPQKQIILMSLADKISCSDKITDELNTFLSGCDDVGVCLAVVYIMNKNKLALSVSGLSGALSGITESTQMKTVLANFGRRSLSGLEVDKLVQIASNSDEVANEVLRHLRYESNIADLGSYNMQLLVEKRNLENIKVRFFEFNLDKKLAERLLVGAIKGNGDDRLSTVNILSSFVSVIDIGLYSQVLLGNDPLKVELVKILAPKTGKYASANKVIEQFLRGRDDDDIKREIFVNYLGFPLDEKTIEAYLAILPDAYDETYEKVLYSYLVEHPSQARDMFVIHYERLIRGYEKVLPMILKYIKYMDESSIIRFATEFKGGQKTKDELFARIVEFSEKPKKIEVDVMGVKCNLLQAYMFTMSECLPSTISLIQSLEKKGMGADDKIIVYGKKVKPKDYLSNLPIKDNVMEDIKRFL